MMRELETKIGSSTLVLEVLYYAEDEKQQQTPFVVLDQLGTASLVVLVVVALHPTQRLGK